MARNSRGELLIFISCLLLFHGWLYSAAEASFVGSYFENSAEFVPLDSLRLKRQAINIDDEPTVIEKPNTPTPSDSVLNNNISATTPLDDKIDWVNDTEFATVNNATIDTTSDNFIYYEVNYHDPPTEKYLKKRWMNISDLLEKKLAKGDSKHPQLVNSYRRAVSYEPSFGIPFYGHITSNLTLATGGFCYIGGHMHSWLAATQYIAPLMANFDTTRKESSILYADTGSVMVVEWRNVYLRHQDQLGSFTFQVQLHKSGDIWFLYKKIPAKVENISDAHHPRKVGLSDAYLFLHQFPDEPSVLTKSKRVIYEYHRIEIDLSKVVENRVMELKAKPTCISIGTCTECVNATLDHFKCNWCALKNGKSFCSDSQGFHRRRQEWITGSCKEQKSVTYCTEEDRSKPGTLAPKTASTRYHTETEIPVREPVITKSKAKKVHVKDKVYTKKTRVVAASSGLGAGGILALLLVVATVLGLSGWIVYAYYNPHTPSGQFLIRYRPGRWRFPGDHGDVRYTASVHM